METHDTMHAMHAKIDAAVAAEVQDASDEDLMRDATAARHARLTSIRGH